MAFIQSPGSILRSRRRAKLESMQVGTRISLGVMALPAGFASVGLFTSTSMAHSGGAGALMGTCMGLGVVALSVLSQKIGISFIPDQTSATRRKIMPSYVAVATAVAAIATTCGVIFIAEPIARDARDSHIVQGLTADLATSKSAGEAIFQAESTVKAQHANLEKMLASERATGGVCHVAGQSGNCTSVLEGRLAKTKETVAALADRRETFDLASKEAKGVIRKIAEARTAIGVAPEQKSANLQPLFDTARELNERIRAELIPVGALQTFRNDLDQPFLKLGMTPAGAQRMAAEFEPTAAQLDDHLSENRKHAQVPLTNTDDLTGANLLASELGSIWLYMLLLFGFEIMPLILAYLFGKMADDIEAEELASRFGGDPINLQIDDLAHASLATGKLGRSNPPKETPDSPQI